MRMLVVLFKIRIVALLLMAATGGAFMAAAGWPGLSALFLIWVLAAWPPVALLL
ncbi:MAG: hypothetical protein M5U34_19060 [Chloroflexi bacterium]|nr:hypothetical protein [Chloroflexota bacterium]